MEARGRHAPLQKPMLVLFLMIIIASVFANHSLTSATTTTTATTSSSSERVNLELYYETLCPYCSNLIVNYLYKIFDTGIIEITNLKLIPYGNAKIRPPNSTIACQHGPYECLLNTIEACAIDVWPDVYAHFPFIYCVEKLVYEGKQTEWETCFEKLGLDQKPVTECYESGRGTELELGYAKQTNDLQPPHKYVPWVVVDGLPLYDDYRSFIFYICEVYQGSPKPPACSESSTGYLKTTTNKGANVFAPVCYKGVTIKSIISGITSALASWKLEVTEAALE